MQDFEGRAKWEFIWRVVTFFLQEDINNFPAGKRFCFADKEPLSFRFEILHLAVGTSGRMNAENRGPISRVFRHIPARREYVFKIPRSFRTLCRSRPHTQIQFYFSCIWISPDSAVNSIFLSPLLSDVKDISPVFGKESLPGISSESVISPNSVTRSKA